MLNLEQGPDIINLPNLGIEVMEMPRVVLHTAGYPESSAAGLRRKMLEHQKETPDCPSCVGIDWATVQIDEDTTWDEFATYEIIPDAPSV